MSAMVDAHVAYCKTIADLNRDKTELLDRIKRLEEAGDRMEKLLPEGSICDKAAIRWTKAREVKP